MKYLVRLLQVHTTLRRQILAILPGCAIVLAPAHAANLIDYHQHLFSPQALSVFSAPRAVTAADLIAQMDTAGIDRAVVLSTAYGFSNPFKNRGPEEYARVRAENDWISMQVGMYPRRLIGFCAVNPLRDYALQEIERCSKDPNLRTGLKLYFGNSDVNLDIEEHVQRTIAVFAAANAHGMAIVVHAHSNIDHNRPYGAKEARAFLEALLRQPRMLLFRSRIWREEASTTGRSTRRSACMRTHSNAEIRAYGIFTLTHPSSNHRKEALRC